jgi:TPR repeat protein
MLALAVELLDADPDEAARWLDRAIAAGSSTAMLLRGLALRESDPAAERAWYERAIRSGGTPTLNMLATLHAEDDPERARAWLRLSRDAGDPNAGYIEANLGCLLEFRDVDAARAWHECSARAGHVDAMLHLGELLHDSDPDASRGWYERAVDAAEGVAPAEPPAAE